MTSIGMRPTIRQLEYLVALDTHGHVGRAAAACFVTQPTLSAQIRELEKHVGVAVTERVGRGIAVTAAGRELAARARVILQAADELLESAHRSETELTGPLRVGAIPTVAPYLLARVLPAVRERHPSVEMHLLELQTASLMAALAAAELDLGLMALPIEDERIEYEIVLVDPFLLAMAPDHRLANQSHVSMRGSATRRCCCWRTATACGIRLSRSAIVQAPATTAASRAPACTPSARWWRRAWG